MDTVSYAMNVATSPLRLGNLYGLSLKEVLEEAVRDIVRQAPRCGVVELAPHIEGLGHLIRVFLNHELHGRDSTAVGFFRIQLAELEELIREHPGDPASACRRLGMVFGAALIHLGRDNDETFVLPDMFRPPSPHA